MNSLIVCFNALAPVFIIIAAGYAAKRVGIIREEEVARINALCFKVFQALMCFNNLYTSNLSSAFRPKLIAFGVIGMLAMVLLGTLYGNRFVADRARRGVVIQGLYRTNFLILGIPLAANLAPDGDIGVVSVLAAIVLSLSNALSIVTLETCRGERADPRKVAKSIATNPIIVSSVLGILTLVLHIKLPYVIEAAVRDMARICSPLMIFLLGAFFRFDGMRGQGRELAAVCIGRLIVFPGIAVACAALLGFRDIEFVAAMLLFATPTAVASFTTAQQLGGDASLAGNIVLSTSLLCSLTLFGWSVLFKSLGFF